MSQFPGQARWVSTGMGGRQHARFTQRYLGRRSNGQEKEGKHQAALDNPGSGRHQAAVTPEADPESGGGDEKTDADNGSGGTPWPRN
jgi:hypothetical protein